MPIQKLPDDDHVLRGVSPRNIHWDEEATKVIGIFPQALRLRDREDYLSVTWVEFFSGASGEQVKQAARATREVRHPGKNGGFAVALVGAVQAVCKERGRSVRILHEETPENAAHAAIRGYPENDDLLLDLLCEKAFSTLILNKDVDG